MRGGHRQPRGFALVVTLSLMILLTILAVGLLGLSSISMRSSGRDLDLMQAKANARLALQIAIGELQKELGPDRRISAAGGQQLDEADISGRKNWVGTYESWPATTVDRPQPVFRKWLISGDDAVTASKEALKKATAFSMATEPLASAMATSNAVEPGVIKLKDGGYAWWVSDNNMKAKIGNAAVTPADAIQAVAQLQAPPRQAYEPLLGSSIAKDDARLNQLISLKTVDLLSKPAQSVFHDATTFATGLVTNVRAGGFRKDLSFLLEKPYAQVYKAPLYSAGATDGMNFAELWVDHNVWGELATSGLPAHADGGAVPAGPYLKAPATKADAYNDPFRKFHQLTRIQHTILYSLISRPKAGSTTNEYDLLLVADPIFTIWNPFNVPIYIPASAYSTFQNWAIPYRLTLNVQKASGTTLPPWSANIPQISGTGFNQGKIGSIENLVMRPGEVQVLSESYGNVVKKQTGSIDAKLGWNFGAGFEFSLTVPKTNTDGSTDPNSLKLPVINGDDMLTFALAPAGGGQSHGLGLTFSRQYIGDEGPYATGNFSIDWTTVPLDPGRNGSLGANARPEVFREIPLDPSNRKQVSALSVPAGTSGALAKWTLCLFSIGFRTEDDPHYSAIAGLPPTAPPPRYTGKSILSINPKSLTYDLGDLSPEWTRETPIQVGFRRVKDLNRVVDTAGAGLGYFGASPLSDTGSSYVITHAVPRAPMISLGALQNSLADGLPDNSTVDVARASNFSRVWYLRPAISHAIANSFAPGIMAPDKTAVSKGAGTKYARDLADHSYLANRALWDDYFYSSISPVTTTAHRSAATAYSEQKDRLTKFLGVGGSASTALPNARFKPWAGNAQAVVDEIFTGNTPQADAEQRTAAHLLVDGAFNVNSTSLNAWKCVLSSLKGAPVPVAEPSASSGTPVLTATTETPVAGLLVAGGGKISDSDIASSAGPLQWRGFRSLTDTQIDELAKAIVKQVRLRGPFTSLADFVNRRPGTDKDKALSGALQSALDDTAVSINAPYRSGTRALSVADASAQGYEFPEAEAGAKSAGAPGYVKQGDLLTAMGPVIAVRSDSFTIRTYGEARNKANQIVAKVYCEAVVQRVPDYVDPADEARVAIPTSAANQTFGRKFQVVSFRYLKREEI